MNSMDRMQGQLGRRQRPKYLLLRNAWVRISDVRQTAPNHLRLIEQELDRDQDAIRSHHSRSGSVRSCCSNC